MSNTFEPNFDNDFYFISRLN